MFLLNDALNDIEHMVNDHPNSEWKPAATTIWATLSDLQQGFFYMHHCTDRIAHNRVFDTQWTTGVN